MMARCEHDKTEEDGCRDCERYFDLVRDHKAMRAVIQQYLDYYSGEKRLRLGTGFAFQWYDAARETLAALRTKGEGR